MGLRHGQEQGPPRRLASLTSAPVLGRWSSSPLAVAPSPGAPSPPVPTTPSENSSCPWVAPQPFPPGTPLHPAVTPFSQRQSPSSLSPLLPGPAPAPPPVDTPRPPPRGALCSGGHAPSPRSGRVWPRGHVAPPRPRGNRPPSCGASGWTARLAHSGVGPALPPAAGSGPQPRVRVPPPPVRIRLRYSLAWSFEESGAGRSAAWPEASPGQAPAESCLRAARAPSWSCSRGFPPGTRCASAPRRPCIPPVLVKGVRCDYRVRFLQESEGPLLEMFSLANNTSGLQLCPVQSCLPLS